MLLIELLTGVALVGCLAARAKSEGGVDKMVNKQIEKTTHDLSRNRSISPEKREAYKRINEEYKATRYEREREEREQRYWDSLKDEE